ncbi:MAG: helix-turn-helix transcriptional regulator [Lachnospiraceae bacterium]|nr:helix-turn-helix transcriptional regulator [Lachnospiraceae bacterium]
MCNGSNKIRVSKIYKRFILSFLIVLLLPVICFAFIFLQNYREIYREKVLNLAQNSLEASVMELERTTEGLESFVAYNLMAESISETVLLKDYSAEQITNIISAEMIAQPILESISYYNSLTPDTIYVINGTYELKYYASSHMYMANKEYLLEQLNNPENVGWTVWERMNATKEGSEPTLMYISRTWKRECWLFLISVEQLDAIINAEQSVTVLQDREGKRLYPFVSGESPDTPEFDGDEEGYCEITVSASNGSFTLTRYIDEDYLFAEVNAWQNYFFTVIIAVLLAGGILILLLTTFNEHPIRKLQRDWRKKIPDMPENIMGLEALQFAMKSMEEQVIITETRQKKNHLLLQLIYGKDCETENFRKRMKDAGLFLHAEVYRVLIAVSDEAQEVSINKLGVYLDMFREEGFELRVIETSSADASIIIAGMTRASEKELKNKLLQIVDEIDRSVNKKISVYVGGKYEEWGKIHLSYTQALSSRQNKEHSKAAKEHRDGAKRVIYYQPATRKDIGKFHYPSAELNTLYTALVETDMDKASAVTERLVEILQKQSENRFISVSLYYDVLNIYYGAQAKLDLDIDSNVLEVDLLEMQTNLDVIQMILRIRDQFRSYIESYRQCNANENVRGQTETSVRNAGTTSDAGKDAKKEDNIITRVLAFIDENSHSCDLSVSMISDYFNMSISNLSHRFKAQTNRTISDYVTEKKFGYAGELLLTTDYSVQKIASMTGYSQPASFIRKFKQYYGMTPVEYRNSGGGSRDTEEETE